MKLMSILPAFCLALAMTSQASFAAEGVTKIIVGVDTKIISSSSGLLAAMETISRGVYANDEQSPSGVCAAGGVVQSINAKPSPMSPLTTPYVAVEIRWSCEAARDLLIGNISKISGFTVLK